MPIVVFLIFKPSPYPCMTFSFIFIKFKKSYHHRYYYIFTLCFFFFLPQALIQPLHTSNDPIISTQHVHIGQPVIGFNPTGVQSASPETSKDIFYDLFYGPLALSILFSGDVFFSAKRSII